MRADDARLRLYVNTAADIDDETLLTVIRDTLVKNCFIEGRKNFVNISRAVLLLMRGMDRGEHVVGLFKKVSDALCNERSSKTIERSVRSAVRGAWSRAVRHGVFEETTLLKYYSGFPRSKVFLRDVAENVMKQLPPEA